MVKIAISGKSGCGNSTVSRRVAERLGYRLVNYTFKDVAEERGISFEEVRRLAEQDPSIDRDLDRRQVEMAREGDTVLASRLAIWKLEDADLKVYLEAPLPVRAARIRQRKLAHGREQTDYETILHETEDRDQRDHNRYLKLYGIDNDEYLFADMVVNAGALHFEEIADQIIAAAQRKESSAES
jgi:cytidylate kinase